MALKIFTHVYSGKKGRSCSRCDLKIPIIIQDGKEVDLKKGVKVGVIEAFSTEPSAYIIGKNDTNELCANSANE